MQRTKLEGTEVNAWLEIMMALEKATIIPKEGAAVEKG